jgi:ribosomal protein L7Ae-like RNA K-turn-binding protein
MDSLELLKRILPYVRGKQVIFGRERMEHLIRQQEAGLVWMMSDFSKNGAKKTIVLCLSKDIPCMWAGNTSDIDEIVGMPNIKVITLRKSFSGLKHILEQLDEADLIYH